jgi:hypothetical protein
MWVAGGRRANVLLRTEDPIDHLAVTAESPIATALTVSMGAQPVVVRIVPGTATAFDVPVRGVRGYRSYAYLLSAFSSGGFVPHLQDPVSQDSRNLGALLRFAAVPSKAR